MSLPRKFDSALQKSIGARAVWLPGSPIAIGDVMVRRDDRFFKGGTLAQFGATMEVKPHAPINGVNIRSTKTKQTIIQAGAEVTQIEGVADEIEARVRYEFAGETEFIAKTPNLQGDSIQNMFIVAATVAAHPAWKHSKFYIVEQTLTADDWAFVGSDKASSKFELSGKGSAIKQFLTVGASVGLTKTSNVGVEFMGSGPVGMMLVRVRKDGSLDHG